MSLSEEKQRSLTYSIDAILGLQKDSEPAESELLHCTSSSLYSRIWTRRNRCALASPCPRELDLEQ